MSLLKSASCIAILLLVLFFAALAYRSDRVLFLLSSIIVLFISLWMMHATVRVFNFRHPTIPAVWFFCYLTMSWLPSLFIFMGITLENYSYPIYPGPHLYTYLLATTSVLLTVPAGVWFTNWLLHFNTTDLKKYFDRPVAPSADGGRAYVYLLGAALGLTLLYFREVKQLPIVAMFQNPGNFTYLAYLREESFTALESRFLYAYSVAREALYPFLIALALGNYLSTRRKKWLFLFLLSFGAGIVYAAVSIARGPVATILLVVTASWYLHRSGRVFNRQVAIGVALVFAYPVLVSIFASTDTTVFDALRIVFFRLFYSTAYVAYLYFEVVPKEVHFQYGATIEKIAWVLGKPHFDLARYVLFTMYPDAPASGSAGGAFFADFYANFGIPGVLAGGALIGIIMQSIQIFITRAKKTTASLAAYAFMFYAFFMTMSRPLPTVLLSTGVSFVFIFWHITTRGDSQPKVKVQS